tara:strand:+ start:87 stop:656 length:570 start_codon:yes stop_codon:yes gene_type:complete
MSGILIYNQPHLINKILYEYGGLCHPTALCMKKDTSFTLINDNKNICGRECREEFINYYSILTIHNHIFNKRIEQISFFSLTIEDYSRENEIEYLPYYFSNDSRNITHIIKRIDNDEECNDFMLSIELDVIYELEYFEREIKSYETEDEETEDEETEEEKQWYKEYKEYNEQEMKFDYYDRENLKQFFI